MIAANHPRLGAALSVDPLAALSWRTVERPMPLQPIRTFVTPSGIVPVQPGTSMPVTATPAEPLQKPNIPLPQPEPLPAGSSSTLDILPASVPASASATGTDTTVADTTPFSLSDWLTEETLFPGYPNGLIAAGGVIALAWLLGGKKRR